MMKVGVIRLSVLNAISLLYTYVCHIHSYLEYMIISIPEKSTFFIRTCLSVTVYNCTLLYVYDQYLLNASY